MREATALMGKACRADDRDQAATLLKEGRLVAFPTETVYGLGADATNGLAVAAIFEAKRRPYFNPLISHLPEISRVDDFALWNQKARDLADAFWPGPLTLVLPRTPNCIISDLVSAGLDTVALRIPSDPQTLALLRATRLPVAAPSANLSGRVSPTMASHVEEELGSRVSMILDGGACEIGLESTVLGFENDDPVLMRPGGIPVEDLELVVGRLRVKTDPAVLQSPGQLASHYAPRKKLRLNAINCRTGELLVGFGVIHDGSYNLSPNGDLREAAANLFSMLRQADHDTCVTIAVAPIPNKGLGRAINDRLQRAAAPRS